MYGNDPDFWQTRAIVRANMMDEGVITSFLIQFGLDVRFDIVGEGERAFVVADVGGVLGAGEHPIVSAADAIVKIMLPEVEA